MSARTRVISSGLLVLFLASCGGSGFLSGLKGTGVKPDVRDPQDIASGNKTIWDLFTNADNPNTTINVNKYIWNAALDVLSFLPVQAADPFSGVIVMGWGRAKGASRSYRATVYIQDPALDARSLKVALVSKSGPASPDTVRAIEDAILTRARQLRIADGKL